MPAPSSPARAADLRVAFVHDWLNGMRGGENCLEELCRLFPDADVFTLHHDRGRVSPTIENRAVHTSFVQHLPAVRTRYRYYLPLFPRAIERMPIAGYDLVVSLSHCVAKGARVVGPAPHLCYCLTPMRYAWDLADVYFGPERAGRLVRLAAALVLPYLRRWDRRTAIRVDRFVGISQCVQERIRRIYGRDAGLVYPPVDTEFFDPSRLDTDGAGADAYLMVTALAPYKGVDLAIEAFRGSGRRLVVIGTGQDRARLRALAGDEVVFVDRVSREALREHYARARALLLPAEEDFGIAPVEAQAMGTPVVGLARGGLRETIVDLDAAGGRAPTGVLFEDPAPGALAAALDRFEASADRFDPRALREHAERFSRRAYLEGMLDAIEDLVGHEAVAAARARARDAVGRDGAVEPAIAGAGAC